MTDEDPMDFEGETVTIRGNTVTVGKQIGSGNEGRVFRIEGQPEDVVKIFKPDLRDTKRPKVRAMVGNAPPDPTAENKGFKSIIWPEAVALDSPSGSFLGYKMPYKDLDDWVGAYQYADTALRWDNSEPKNRFKTARNLAITVRNVHKTGHAIGDFNDRNILVADDYITLIDTDAFTIKSGDTIYSDTSYLPRYSPPEKREESLAAVKRADYFCLSVHIFQFLMEGFHPFQADGDEAYSGDWPEMIEANPFPYVDSAPGIEPFDSLEKKYSQLPAPVQQLFEESFANGSKSHPWGRPKPTDWIKTLGSLTNHSVDADHNNSGSTTSGSNDTSGESVALPDFGAGGGTTSGSDTGSTSTTSSEPSLPDFSSSAAGGSSSGEATSEDNDDDDLNLPDFAS